MIYIFYGENFSQSRIDYINTKNKFINQDCLPVELSQDNINDLDKWLYQAQGLFNKKIFFYSENIFNNKSNHKELLIFDNKKGIDLIDWGQYQYLISIKKIFKNLKLNESKIPISIFKFLDLIYPDNLNDVLNIHNQISQNIDSYFIYYMVSKHIKELLLTDSDSFKKTVPSWKYYKLINQSKLFKNDTLKKFYFSLCKLEQQIKSGSIYYNQKQALDILFCYYLR